MNFLNPDLVKSRAKDNKIPISSSQTIHHITQLLIDHKPSYCVELGTAIGWGTYHIAQTIQQWNGRIHTFEISYPTHHFSIHFLHHNHIHNVHSYHCDIHNVPLCKLLTHRIDFLYIDAHKASYIEYFNQFLPFLSDNALVVFDDITQYANKIGTLHQVLTDSGRTYQEYSTDDTTDHLLVCRRLVSS